MHCIFVPQCQWHTFTSPLCFQGSLLNSRRGPFTPPKPYEQMSPCVCACGRVSREFGRWKVNSLAVEKRDSIGGSGGLALPLDPDFQHTIRQLGRRPTLQTITESLIKKYGTHLLLAATLGGTVEYAELQSKPDSHSLFDFCTLGTNFTVCCFLNNKEYNNLSGSVLVGSQIRKSRSGLALKKINKLEKAVKVCLAVRISWFPKAIICMQLVYLICSFFKK